MGGGNKFGAVVQTFIDRRRVLAWKSGRDVPSDEDNRRTRMEALIGLTKPNFAVGAAYGDGKTYVPIGFLGK